MKNNKQDYKQTKENGKNIKAFEKTGRKFDSADHYFKLNERILDIESTKDLSKPEVLIYALHNRCKNPKGMYMGCSVAGRNFISKALKIPNNRVIDNAMSQLKKKHFLAECINVKTGKFKSTAIEVSPFPEYFPPQEGESTGKFLPGKRDKKEKIIQIPSKLIDDQILSADLSRQEVFSLFYLYSLIDWQKYMGIDYNLIRYESPQNDGFELNGVFPEGTHPSLCGNKRYYVTDKNRELYIHESTNFKQGNLGYCIEQLVMKGIFRTVPFLVEIDEDEPDLLKVKKQIFKNIMDFKYEDHKDYWFDLEDPERKKIIWILQPAEDYCVLNPSYEDYKKNRDKIREDLKRLHSHPYLETLKSKQVELLMSPDFPSWFVQNHRDEYQTLLKKFPWINEVLFNTHGYNEHKRKDEVKQLLLSKINIEIIMQYNKLVGASKN